MTDQSPKAEDVVQAIAYFQGVCATPNSKPHLRKYAATLLAHVAALADGLLGGQDGPDSSPGMPSNPLQDTGQ